jgi:tetratricopeptide (TPR) repeat protein
VTFAFHHVRRCVLLLFVAIAACSIHAQTCEQRIARTLSLAAEKNWAEAESAARASIDSCPESSDARRTLGQVLLWTGRYDEARKTFAALLGRNGDDVESRVGLAQAAYWSGDYRLALREFERILRQQPARAEAQRAVAEIRSASRPGYTASLGGIDDDQPYRSTTADITAHVFSDPLTKWQLGLGTTRLHALGITRDVHEVSGGGETLLPSAAIGVRASLRWMRFPDDRSEVLPLVSIERRFGRSRAAISLQRRELLRAGAALHSHPFVDAFAIRWSREEPDAMQFSAGAESLRYFDGNRGTSADGYVLAPFGRFLFGASTAYRNTHEPRFRADTGEYDPYWTPHDLREVRAIAAAQIRSAGATFDLHLDGGIARDRVLYFAAGAPSYERTFHPWHASLAVTAPPIAQMTFRFSVERISTVFYTANEIHASVAGRF